MMAHCFTPIRGRRMRVTKVNALGRPVYGPNAFVTTSGFVSVQFTPEIAEGEETEVRTASGEICVSERGCDELRWITVQIEFCQVDPCLFTLINETWTELRDCVGEVIGWAESHKFSCDSGFALELWTDVTGYTPTTPGAQGAWGYLLLPFIVGGTLGEQTVENGAISFTITGRTKKGSGWLNGPYDVMCNDPLTGACGPLLTPVGAEEPRRIMLTTCPPPAAACGCQPLSSPDGPPATVVENTSIAGRMTVTADIPSGTPGTFRVSWGDGTAVEDLVPGTPFSHTYSVAGTYHVSIWDSTNTQKVTVDTVTVPFTGAVAPVFTVAQEGGDAHAARVTVTNPAAGRVYQVKWLASQVDWEDLPTTGSPAHSAVHTYSAPDGQKAITVRDKADPTKQATTTITIPFPVTPILLVTEEDGDSTRRTTRVTVTNPQAGVTYEISWAGTGGTFTAMQTTGNPAHSETHQQTTGTSMTVVVRQVGTPSNAVQEIVTLPHPGPQFTLGQDGVEVQTARVTMNGSPAGTYEVNWDGGATWTPFDGTTTPPYSITNAYGSAGLYQVWVRPQATPASVAKQQVKVPFVGGLGLAAAEVATSDGDTTTARKRTK